MPPTYSHTVTLCNRSPCFVSGSSICLLFRDRWSTAQFQIHCDAWANKTSLGCHLHCEKSPTDQLNTLAYHASASGISVCLLHPQPLQRPLICPVSQTTMDKPQMPSVTVDQCTLAINRERFNNSTCLHAFLLRWLSLLIMIRSKI